MIIICFIFSFDIGIVSRFLSNNAFRLFSKFQLEFFILHAMMIKCLTPLYKNICSDLLIANLLLFVTTVLIAYLYNKFLKKPFATLFDKIVLKILCLIELN